nr:hypothetical protein [Tanacetum cinerariifolium]
MNNICSLQRRYPWKAIIQFVIKAQHIDDLAKGLHFYIWERSQQSEGQAGPNLGEQDEGQDGPNPSDVAASQPQSSLVVHAGPNLKHTDLKATDKHKLVTETSDKPSPAKRSKPGLVTKRRKPTSFLRSVDESVDEGIPEKEPRFDDEEADVQRALEESLKSIYDAPRGPLLPMVIREPESGKYQPLLEVQGKGKKKENLKLTVEEHVILEEHASSTRTLSSLQHLAKDLGFGDLFYNDKPSEADNE